MTKRKLPSIPDGAISRQILTAFSKYLTENPTRSIVLSRPGRGRSGWLVETVERRATRGESLQDATAQLATVLLLDSDEVTS